MLYIKSFIELLDILKEGVREEECGHASYISRPSDISMLLETVNKNTSITPEFIDFNNFIGEGSNYYTFSFDYLDGELTYSISPAIDEEGHFYTDFGLCLVDECVPKIFEEEYKEESDLVDDYESPIRICWGEEPEEDEDEDCKKCEYECDAPCCKMNLEQKTKVDTDDNGKLLGFSKQWKDKNSFFTYSFHSTNEEDVLDLMKKFKISQF